MKTAPTTYIQDSVSYACRQADIKGSYEILDGVYVECDDIDSAYGYSLITNSGFNRSELCADDLEDLLNEALIDEYNKENPLN